MAKEFTPDPKPAPKTKKSSFSSKKLNKPMTTEEETDKPTRTEINARNRNFGKSVERSVAKLTGGDRVPASGAIKTSNLDLTGDVQVKDAAGRPLIKIESKGTSALTPSGDKTFT